MSLLCNNSNNMKPSTLLLLSFVVTLAIAQPGAPPGGFSTSDPTKEHIDILEKVRPEIEKMSKTRFLQFDVVEFGRQVVAGFNYFYKIHVSEEKDGFIFVKIYRAPGPMTKPQLVKVETGKAEEDKLTYF
ncbi:cystatin-A-like [Planoprotostelium fungivorum]|uniref:Cystatin-A-like n=1 Tax=Planoprotostelium fungivorum TaxID=1890364 RepID=A0A2P6NFA2_9EUKA|nr:cystatin-A-like [Planoprotostelium fungivorum]